MVKGKIRFVMINIAKGMNQHESLSPIEGNISQLSDHKQSKLTLVRMTKLTAHHISTACCPLIGKFSRYSLTWFAYTDIAKEL